MRSVRWSPATPGHSEPNGAVEITAACRDMATALEARFTAAGQSAACVDAPSGSTRLTIITEGLGNGDLTARHWAALDAARRARPAGGHIILLQRSAPDTGLEGLARTLRQEWPDNRIVCWTLPQGDASDTPFLDGWFGNDTDDLWFMPDGAALRAELGGAVEPATIGADHAPGTWLITGGARGVTAACAVALAREAGGRFILAGRSAETAWPEGVRETSDLKTLRGLIASAAAARREKLSPAGIDAAARAALAGLEIRTTLDEIRANGAEAHYLRMDTSDPASIAAAVAAIRSRFGPVTGLVHGAGIIADRLVDDKTEAELARVFAPKAGGLFHILAQIDRTVLRHVGLFSSASAFFGNRGQADYAMANAILGNAGRALANELPAARVKVFDWGPWEGGMVDAALASHFRQQGVALIPLSEGARIFTHELLAGDPDQVELVIGTIGGAR